MRRDNTQRCYARLRAMLVMAGIVVAIPSTAYLVLGIAGIVPTDMLSIAGASGIRTIASVAVLGCLMAAVGYWDS